ncbi:transcriptional regulator [Candidatus Parcubacteria bacterium]|nr:transcriptional regulator [Candidatus Parcubacteria bacterium]
MENPKLDIFSKFLKEFQGESDRGAAILAVSMLDQKLKDVLLDFLIDCKASSDLISGYNAPLGTFSSRLNICYSLGLISDNEYNDATIIRRIRNDFAHKFEFDFSFKSQKVAALCWNLKGDVPRERHYYNDDPRAMFIHGVVFLYVNLLYREEHVNERRLKRPNWHSITWGRTE